MMNESISAIAAAAWLGLLCTISPCPMATNIAAISFLGRKVGSVGAVLSAGFLYTLGRVLTYAFLGILLVNGFTAAPELSNGLQKYMDLLMGPLLILVAMVLLGLINLKPSSGSKLGEFLRTKTEGMGICGAFFLGILFALSFCPTSAALFFGSLVPLAIKLESGILLPAIFGVATGLPVLLFAFLLAFSANKVGKVYNHLAKFEVWAQRITGAVFLIVGIVLTLTQTLGLKL